MECMTAERYLLMYVKDGELHEFASYADRDEAFTHCIALRRQHHVEAGVYTYRGGDAKLIGPFDADSQASIEQG